MPVSSPSRTLKIFLSYATISSEDTAMFTQLSRHLRPLQHCYPHHEWYDSELIAGSPITHFIETRLHMSDLIILLVSADFFASPRCYELEMQQALARAASGGARLIPVLLRPTDWQPSSLSRYRALPSNGVPLSLWPDRDAALTDVVQGIRQTIEELSTQETSAVSLAAMPNCDPPYPYDDLFTDREALLTAITDFFHSARPRRSAILALSGIGGIGKTAIALEYCYHTSETYQYILWFNASSRSVLRMHVCAFAEGISLPHAVRQDEQQLFAMMKQWLRDQSGWLLVLDQVEDMTLVDLLVPPLSNGHVLLTTRQQDTRKRASILPIPSLSLDDSALFLLRRIHILPAQASLDQAPAEIIREALALAREMDGFPLALDQAGAYLETWGGDLTSYLALYKKQRTHLLSEYGQREEKQPIMQSEMNQLHVFPFTQFSETSSLDLLYLLAFLYPDAIPESLIVHGAQAVSEPLRSLALQPVALHQALGELRRSSLVRYHADRTVLQIQRIVQDAIIDRLPIEQQRSWAQQAVSLVDCAFPEIRFDTQATCERYLPQAQRCATLIATYHLTSKAGAHLLERLGSFCARQGSYQEARKYLTQALRLYERHLPHDLLDMAQTLNSLGRLAHRRAQYKQSLAFHQRALKIRENKLGPDDPKTAESLHNLALTYGELGKYQEAEQLYQRVLSIEEQTKGSDDPDVADTLNNLGLMYAQQGHYTAAEKAYWRALSIYKRSLAANHPDQAYPLHGLGALAEQRGQIRQAEQLYTRALHMRQHAFGERHPEVARSVNKLAGIAVTRGDSHEAETLYRQALHMSEELLGSRHPDVAVILNNQALLATQQGRYAEAETRYQRALSIYRLVLGREHPSAASVLHNLGKLYCLTGKTQQAEKSLQRALAIREKVLGTTHPHVAQSLVNLADLLIAQRRYEEAEPLLQRALALYSNLSSLSHPEIAQLPEKYASLMQQIHGNKEAQTPRDAEQSREESESG